MKKLLFTLIMLVFITAIISNGAPVWFIILISIISIIGVIAHAILRDSHDTRMRGHKRGEKY